MLTKLSNHVGNHPLSYRLLIFILAFSSVFTLLGTGLQLYWEYRTDLEGLDDILQQIEDSHLDSLTTSQWMLDDKQTLAQINGILRLPSVVRVEIRPQEDGAAVTIGSPVSERNIRRIYPLVHMQRGREVRLGELEVTITLEGVYNHLRGQVLMILGTQAVKTFATSFFILFIVQYLFTRHLHTLGEHAKRLSLNKLETSLTLNRSTDRPADELDHVVNAMEDMRHRLIDELATLRSVEEKRQQLITKLKASYGEMESFAHRASHDLKSPLITIRGFLGLLRGDLAKQDLEQAEEDIARIESAADMMYTLVEDLLQLSRAGQLIGTPENVDLSQVAGEAVELVSGRIAERGARVTVDPDLPIVRGDPVRLRLVFQNLIENSIKFMGEASEPQIEVGTRPEAGETVCYVADNGIGIAPRDQEKIFELFDKLDESAAGTGIGLALVQRIIIVHGGRIWVESAGLGHGTKFSFTLPSAPKAGFHPAESHTLA